MKRFTCKMLKRFTCFVVFRVDWFLTSRLTIFSVMLGRSHRFLGITSTFWGVNVPCSRTQHGLTQVGLEPPTSGSGVRGINRQATTLPGLQGINAVFLTIILFANDLQRCRRWACAPRFFDTFDRTQVTVPCVLKQTQFSFLSFISFSKETIKIMITYIQYEIVQTG